MKTTKFFTTILFSIVFLLSCKKESFDIHNIDKIKIEKLNNFHASLVRNVKEVKSNNIISNNLVKSENNTIKNASIINNSLNPVIISTNENSKNFTELIQASTELLVEFDIYDDLLNEFGNSNNENIISSALVVYMDQLVNNEQFNSNMTSTGELTFQEVGACVASAFGLSLGSLELGRYASKAAMVRGIVGTVAKFASKWIGPIGVAISGAYLLDCLMTDLFD